MVGWTAWNSYSNKSSQPKRKLLLFPSGFILHYSIRIKSQDYNEADNAISLDHFQMRSLHYQNLWKNSSGKGVRECYLSLPQPKSLLQSDWLIFKWHLLLFYFFQNVQKQSWHWHFDKANETFTINHNTQAIYCFEWLSYRHTHSCHLQITGVFGEQMLSFT